MSVFEWLFSGSLPSLHYHPASLCKCFLLSWGLVLCGIDDEISNLSFLLLCLGLVPLHGYCYLLQNCNPTTATMVAVVLAGEECGRTTTEECVKGNDIEDGMEEPLNAIDMKATASTTNASETDPPPTISSPLEVVPVVVLDQNNPLKDDDIDEEADQSQAVGVDSPISTRELLNLQCPLLGFGYCSRIVLIDSAVVGVSAGTELAALGPGIAWVDSTAYLLMVIGMFQQHCVVECAQ